MAQLSVVAQATLGTSTNFFVFALYDASAPTVLLEIKAPDKPYGNPIDEMFEYNCIPGRVYKTILWENTSKAAGGLNRSSFSITATNQKTTVRLPNYLTEGITPGLTAGGVSLVDTSIAGWDYILERVGQGTMYPQGEEGVIDPDYSKQDTGGWTLLKDGDTIQAGEKFVEHFLPQVAEAAPDGSPSPIFGSGRIITVDTTLTNADSNISLRLQSATSTLSIILPALSTILDYQFIYLYSFGGSHINASVICPGTDKIQYNSQISKFFLGQLRVLKLYKADGVWNIENDASFMDTIGKTDFVDNIGINQIQAIGQERNRADYPAIWALIQAGKLPTINEASWADFSVINGVNYYPYKGYYTTGDGAITFRFPDLTGKFPRIQATSGGSQNHAFATHAHEGTTYNGNNLFGRGLINRILGAFGSVKNDKADLTNVPVNIDGSEIVSSSETRPINRSFKGVIQIG